MLWTNEQKQRAQELYKKGFNATDIANLLSEEFGGNFAKRSVRRHMHAPEKKVGEELEETSTLPGTHQHQINADGSQLDSLVLEMTDDQLKDVNYVLRAHGFDDESWEILSVTNNLYQQGSKQTDEDGNPTGDVIIKNLYQSKIKVRPKVKTDVDSFVEAFSAEVKPLLDLPKQENSGQNNLVIPLADIHFGITRLSDVQPYLERFEERMRYGFDKIVIENIGDYLHSDQINTTQTVSGTILDDVDMTVAIEEGMVFMDTLIQTALQHANSVDVKYVGGNHDFDSDYMFMYALTQRYREADRVSIDLNNKYRTAYLLGHVLLSVQHGDVAKKDSALRLAAENKELWGESTSAEVHSGHLHTELTKDAGGVVLRQFGTPKKADPYEIKNGYTTNKHELYALEYSDTKLVAEYHI